MKPEKRQPRWLLLVLLITLALAIVLPWASGLDQYVTTDEVLWMYRSGNFYYALGQREFENTFQKTHPGVTVMWAGTAGYLLEFPEYRGKGQGYMDTASDLSDFLKAQGKTPLDILVAGRTVMITGITLLMLAGFWLARKIVGTWAAFLTFMIFALEPTHIGLSQLLQMDGLNAAMIFASVIAFKVYLWGTRRQKYLIISAAAAAGSGLTRMQGLLFLFMYFGLLLLIEHLGNKENKSADLVGNIIRPLAVWLLVAVIVFFLLWPAMWVDPLRAIQGVFGVSSQWATEGHGASIYYYGELLDGSALPATFYPLIFLWKTTPVTVIGLGLALMGYILRWGVLAEKKERRILIALVLFALFYILAINISVKKADRYMIPILPVVVMAAVLGWTAGVARLKDWVKEKMPGLAVWNLNVGVFVFVGALQLWQVVGTFPYPIAYFNPLMGGSTKAAEELTIGWGEGLDQAGRYLAAKPDAEDLSVLSWYGDGPFSYFFPGEVDSFNLTEIWRESSAKKLARADYIVIYYQQWGRQMPQVLLDVLSGIEPEYVYEWKGIPFVQVYAVSDMPVDAYQELIEGAE